MTRHTVDLDGTVFPGKFVGASMTQPSTFWPLSMLWKRKRAGHGWVAWQWCKENTQKNFQTRFPDNGGRLDRQYCFFFWGRFESESAMLSSNLLFIEIILFLNSKFTQSIFSQNSVRSQWLIEFHKSRYGEVTLISSSEDFYLLVLLKSPSHVILISILLICNPKNYFNVKK